MRIHFSGIGGAGMNPLAQLMQERGHSIQGSDRAFDNGKNLVVADILKDKGIELFPQDGTALNDNIDLMIYSAAVEQQTPEMLRAKELKITCQSRPHLLAELVNNAKPGIAVAGTSGKSSVVGIITWIMRSLNMPISVLGGAALAEKNASHMGCFQAAAEDQPLLAEACESDGTLVAYKSGIGLIHNITRDHDELSELREQFAQFANQSSCLMYNSTCEETARLAEGHAHAVSYVGEDSDYALDVVREGPLRAQANIRHDNVDYFIDFPQPGLHNLHNACAAFAVVHRLGGDPKEIANAITSFPGIARRYQEIGVTEDGIRVIDDYAHNADKIRAVISAAQLSCDRLLAIFQPHGFGPARFLRPELKELLPTILRPRDVFCYAPIHYAGGTVAKDISSSDLAQDLVVTKQVFAAETKQDLLQWACEQARPNDTVLLMGARDPSLPQLAQALYDIL